MTSTSPLRVGVLLCGPVQLLDLAAVDLFGMLTPEYLRACQLPDQLVSLGPTIEFRYIGEGKKEGEILETTSDVKVVMTVCCLPHDIRLAKSVNYSYSFVRSFAHSTHLTL